MNEKACCGVTTSVFKVGLVASRRAAHYLRLALLLALTVTQAASATPPTTSDEWMEYLINNPHEMNSVCASQGTPVSDEYLAKVQRYMQRRLGSDYQAWVVWGEDGTSMIAGSESLGRAGPCSSGSRKGFALLFREQPTQLTVLHELGHFKGQFLPIFNEYGYDAAVKVYENLPTYASESMLGQTAQVGNAETKSVQELLAGSRRWKYPTRPGAFSPAEKAAQALYAMTCDDPQNPTAHLVEFEQPDPISKCQAPRRYGPSRGGFISFKTRPARVARPAGWTPALGLPHRSLLGGLEALPIAHLPTFRCNSGARSEGEIYANFLFSLADPHSLSILVNDNNGSLVTSRCQISKMETWMGECMQAKMQSSDPELARRQWVAFATMNGLDPDNSRSSSWYRPRPSSIPRFPIPSW